MVQLPALQNIRIQGQQHANEGLAIAYHHGLGDKRVPAQDVLHRARRDILAAGRDNEVLLAAGDNELAVFINLTQVAGVVPAILEGLGRGFRIIPVTVEDDIALDADFAFLIDAEGHATHRRANSADGLIHKVHRGRGGDLGQAIALIDRDADAAVPVQQVMAHGRATGNAVVHVAAHALADGGVHQLVKDLVLGLQQAVRALRLIQSLGVLDGYFLGLLKKQGLDARISRLSGGRVAHLFKDARNAQNDIRAGASEFDGDGGKVRPVILGGAAHGHRNGYRAGKDVGQRQEGQGVAARHCEDANRVGAQATGLGQPVAVGQDAALGSSGCAGSINQRSQVIGGGGLDAGVDLVGGHAAALELQGIDGRGVNFQHAAQLRWGALEVGFAVFLQHQVFYQLGVLAGFRNGEHGAGVLDDPTHLGGGRGRVDRHGGGTGGPDGKVQQGPLIAGGRDEGDAVPLLHAQGDKSLGYFKDLIDEFFARDVDPLIVSRAGEHDAVRALLRGVHEGGQAGFARLDSKLRRGMHFLQGHAVSFRTANY